MDVQAEVKLYLDDKVKSLGYDDIISACTYASAPNQWQDEAIRIVMWRSDVWERVFELEELGQVPATAEALRSDLATNVPLGF